MAAKVRACRTEVTQLLSWAEPFPHRKWAIEGADGLGYLLAQHLVAAGETVVDVPATLAARTRVLAAGRSNKNDPNDACRSRSPQCATTVCVGSARSATPTSCDCWLRAHAGTD